eukprot:1176025-Prorocentrum_minimum.AAC.1
MMAMKPLMGLSWNFWPRRASMSVLKSNQRSIARTTNPGWMKWISRSVPCLFVSGTNILLRFVGDDTCGGGRAPGTPQTSLVTQVERELPTRPPRTR